MPCLARFVFHLAIIYAKMPDAFASFLRQPSLYYYGAARFLRDYLMIEDALAGIQAAHGDGSRVIGVTTTFSVAKLGRQPGRVTSQRNNE